ncbi:MAG: SurA N-terminal domain-containing protein [Candidatus Zapsychrus exili]|nr:SurA N-terminal domain-containing protein [Candidatus Zapsychrus exili]
MIEQLKAHKKILIIISILIVVSLLATILFSGGIRPKKYIGEMFGKEISSQEFENTYLHVKVQSMLKYGKLFDEFEALIDLEQDAWDQLMLLHEAKKRKIKIQDSAVINEIAKYDIFFRNKKFDKNIYKNIINRSFSCKRRDFEETIRESLTVAKLYDQATSYVDVEDTEILKKYKKETEEIKARYILFPEDKHKEKIQISKEQIKNYYNENKQGFSKPPSINVQYITLNFPDEGGVQKEVETKYKAKAIYDAHKESSDLKTAAEKIGFTLQETGYFSKMDPNFDPKWSFKLMLETFKMEAKEIKEPIELEKGYLIIKIKDKKDSYIPEIEEIATNIQDILISKEARTLAKEEANQYLEKVIKAFEPNEDTAALNIIKQELGLEIKEAPFVSKEQLSFTLDIDETSEKDFLNLDKENNSDILVTSKGACLIYVDDFKPISIDEFNRQKEGLKVDIREKKKEQAFEIIVSTLKNQAKTKKYND